MANLHTIKGIEIFASGVWNGDEYSESDLDDIVEAFGRTGYRPPLVVGHGTTSQDRAVGWVSRVWKAGKKLLADIADVPDSIYQVIKERGFDNVSCEIYWNLQRNGRVWPRALKAIALLGAGTPAVSNLAPLRTSVNDMRYGRVVLCTQRRERNMTTRPDIELHNLTVRRMEAEKSNDYAEAARHVLNSHPELAKAYAARELDGEAEPMSHGQSREGSFGHVLAQAADCLLELNRFEADGKLSAKGFLLAALDVAGCDVERLDEVAKLVEENPVGDDVRKMLRFAAKELGGPNYSQPFTRAKLGKFTIAFGTDGVDAVLSGMGVSVGEFAALAARLATERFAENFGSHADHKSHVTAQEDCRQRLTSYYDELREIVTGKDLVFGQATPDEQRHGLVHARLKRHQGVSLSDADWPAKAVAAELASEPDRDETLLREEADEERLVARRAKDKVREIKRAGKRSTDAGAATRAARRRAKKRAASEAQAEA